MCSCIDYRRQFKQDQRLHIQVCHSTQMLTDQNSFSPLMKIDISCKTFRHPFGQIFQQILDPLTVMLPQVDFIKDMILVVRMITLLGGIVVFTNPHLFPSTVSNLSCCFINELTLLSFFYP